MSELENGATISAGSNSLEDVHYEEKSMAVRTKPVLKMRKHDTDTSLSFEPDTALLKDDDSETEPKAAIKMSTSTIFESASTLKNTDDNESNEDEATQSVSFSHKSSPLSVQSSSEERRVEETVSSIKKNITVHLDDEMLHSALGTARGEDVTTYYELNESSTRSSAEPLNMWYSVAASKATSSLKHANRGQDFKTVFRSFKKFFIKDFSVFEKSNTSSKCAKAEPYWDKLLRYINSKGINSTELLNLHYFLGLVLNPKLILSWTHYKQECESGKDKVDRSQPILIQDLLLRFTLQKSKEFFKQAENQWLFNYFIKLEKDNLKKIDAEIKTLLSTF